MCFNYIFLKTNLKTSTKLTTHSVISDCTCVVRPRRRLLKDDDSLSCAGSDVRVGGWSKQLALNDLKTIGMKVRHKVGIGEDTGHGALTIAKLSSRTTSLTTTKRL